MAIRLHRARPAQRPEPRLRQPVRGTAYHRLVVALSPSPASTRAVRIACEIAADQHVRLAAVAVIEVPLDVPLETPDAAAEAATREAVRTAQAVGATYGVSVEGVVLHARDAGEAIVDEAVARDAQVVVLAADWPQGRGRIRRLSGTTDHVLKHAPCRVLLIGNAAPATRATRAWEPVFRSGRPSDYWPSGEFVDPDGSTSR
ncbi:MAG: universal stress protein [Gaiellaceae bacterium]